MQTARSCGRRYVRFRLAREACTRAPINVEHAKFLVLLLLNAGYVREAGRLMDGFGEQAANDPDLMLSMFRLKLLLRDFDEAHRWGELMIALPVEAHFLVRLGEACESVRKPDWAEDYYQQALVKAYFPEALLGLARLATERRDRQQAKALALSALDMTREPAEHAALSAQLFPQILGQLLALEEPAANCRAWIAGIHDTFTPVAFAGVSLLVYAVNVVKAQEALLTILNAATPGTPPVLPSLIQWREALKEQQPEVPVRPGVQMALGD